jgi:2-C-methyl-D-erythritol 4-phosphate cytidylyltransferase
MKKYAIIVAGGAGVRMGTTVPKQFLLLHGRAVLWYTLQTFLSAYEDLEIILVLPAEHLQTGRTLVNNVGAGRVRFVTGGATRFHSVQNGCRVIAEEGVCEAEGEGGGSNRRGARGESVIFVHDGVRCLLSRNLVHRCHDQAVLLGSAIPVTSSRDSVRLLKGTGSEAIDRSRVKLVQTPQTFLSHLLLAAYEADYQEAFTDDAMVVEAAGHAVHLIEGETNNIKITTPEDLVMAGYRLKQA